MFELKVITNDCNFDLNTLENKNNLYESIECTSKLYRIASSNISLTEKFQTFRFLPLNRTSLIFIIAIPETCTTDSFISFLSTIVQHIKYILFITEPKTLFKKALIQFDSQNSADNFYYQYNTKNFPENKSEFLYCAFISRCICTTYKEQETKNKPELNINEMSTCPLCLEKLENSSSGMETLLNLYPCERWNNYKKHCAVCSKFNLLHQLKCEKCNNTTSLWCCLVCGYIGCNRYQEQHAMLHYNSTSHRYSIELNSQRIWDYLTDNWIHRLINSNECSSAILLEDEDVNTNEENSMSTKEFLLRMENVITEYGKVLSAQMDLQRKNFEVEVNKIEHNYNETYKTQLTKLTLLKEEMNKKKDKLNMLEKLGKECVKKSSQIDKKIKDAELKIQFNNECIQNIKIDIEKLKLGTEVNKIKSDKQKQLQLKLLKKQQLQEEVNELYNELSKVK